MNIHRFACLLVAGVAACTCVHAQEVRRPDKVLLICPDRSPRMADIDLAVAIGRLRASEAVKRQMLERTRSVCAAGLSAATLRAPLDSQFASDTALAARLVKEH
jgi:hypothetical protein